MPELTRREAIAALGGLVATSALPSWGADEPSVFAQRGRFERLVLAYQHVHIGLERPFSVLHVSDTHLTSAYPNEPPAKQELRRIRTQTFGGRREPLLKAILAGHMHITIQEKFSSTATQFVVGGNFMFHGEEILFT